MTLEPKDKEERFLKSRIVIGIAAIFTEKTKFRPLKNGLHLLVANQ